MSADPNCTTWTVVRLKDELRRLRLPLGGNKPDLCRRLQNYYASRGLILPRLSDFNPAVYSPNFTAPALSSGPSVPSAAVRPKVPETSIIPSRESIATMNFPKPGNGKSSRKGPIPKLPYTQKQILDCGLGEDGYITDIISSDVIPPERIITITDGNNSNCFDIVTIAAIVRANPRNPLNPFNQKPLSRQVLDQVEAYNRVNEDNIRSLIRMMSDERTPVSVLKEQIAKIPDLNVETEPGHLTLLNQAIRLNNLSALDLLLNAGADPNFMTARGIQSLPLYMSLQQGNPVYFIDLLKHGANPNLASLHQSLPSMVFNAWQSSIPGLIDIIDLLFQKGYRITYRGYSQLNETARRMTDMILRKYNQPIPNLASSFNVLIDNAITSGNVDDLVYLDELSPFQYSLEIQEGISPSTQTSFLRTALQKQPNNVALLETMLRHLTRISTEDVIAAPNQVSRQLVNMARLQTLGRDLYNAAANGDIVETRRLLDEGVNPNLITSEEHSPLTDAVNNNHWDVARLLMDRGALRGDILQTALRVISARNGPMDIAERMVEAGAIPTAVLYDIYDRGGEMTSQRLLYLINLGAFPAEDDVMAYRLAIRDNNIELFNRLLDLGLPLSDIDYRRLGQNANPAFPIALRNHGITLNNGIILRSSISTGNLAYINQLLDMIGADNIVGINEALVSSIRSSNAIPIIETLIKHGANPLADNRAALREAINSANFDAIMFFNQYYPREMATLQR